MLICNRGQSARWPIYSSNGCSCPAPIRKTQTHPCQFFHGYFLYHCGRDLHTDTISDWPCFCYLDLHCGLIKLIKLWTIYKTINTIHKRNITWPCVSEVFFKPGINSSIERRLLEDFLRSFIEGSCFYFKSKRQSVPLLDYVLLLIYQLAD